MFFNNRYKEEIDQLKEEINRLKEDISYQENKYKKIEAENYKLQQKLLDKDYQLQELTKIKEENKIMKEYYKVDEDLSPEVQAKVIIDLRLHDMEYQKLHDNLTNIKIQLQQLQYQSLCAATCIGSYPFYMYHY